MDILKRLKTIFFWLGSISTIVLIVLLFNRFTNKKPQPPPRVQQYELQKEHLISLDSLANSSVIHSFFTDLSKKYAEKFAESKKIDISQLPSLKFAGFYYEQKTDQGLGTMGHCFPRQLIYPYEEETINIELNRLYYIVRVFW